MRDWLLSLLAAFAGRTAPPRVAPEPLRAERRRLRVSPEAVGRSRLALRRDVPEAFRAVPPPKGIVPPGERAMALDEDLGAWVAGQSVYSETLNWLGIPFLAELTQRSEYRQIVETLAKDMTRRWIKVTSQGDEDKTERVAQIDDALKKYKIREKFRRLAELDGFFGRGHLYIDTGCTEDRELLKVPLILDRRTFEPHSLRDFRVIEPAWTYPGNYNARDPLAEDFYAPRTWYVFGKEVHRSRLLTLVSREVPDLLKPTYQFGGVSMSQLARPYIDNWLRTRQSVSDLVHAFSTMVLETDLSDILQDGGAQSLFDRIELYNNLRDNRGTFVVDKDREALSNVSTPLGTLDRLQAQSQEQLAAVSHTPLIVLLGITPSGLNASSDGELQVWAQWVRSMQEHLFDGPLDRVIKCLQIDMWGEIDPDIGFDYEPLRELSDAERAAADKQEADTHAVYVNAGVIGPDEVRQALAEDEGSPYAGIDLSGPPPAPPPQSEEDPLGGPPDASAPPGGADVPGADAGAPDAASGVALAIEARRAENAYQNWFRGARDAFEESKHPRDHGKFTTSDLKSIADVSLPTDTDTHEHFYHATRDASNLDKMLKEGIQSRTTGGKVFLSKNEIRDLGQGFAIVRVPKGTAKKGVDRVEPGLSYEEHTVPHVPAHDVVRVVRSIPIGGGHSIREDELAKYALENPGLNDADVKSLPEKYQQWFHVKQAQDEDLRPVERRQYGSLQIGIETRRGEARNGGTLAADYGYIMRTTGADGDRVDVFVGPLEPTALPAFVLEQHHANGRPDEHKVFIGFQQEADALSAYDRSYNGDGPDKRGRVYVVPFSELRAWLRDHPMRVSQASAGYGPGQADGEHCGVCRHFEAPHGCARVLGMVDAMGWCKLWEAA